MVGLTLHWAQACHLEEKPLQLLVVQRMARGIRIFSVGVVLIGQVNENGSTFTESGSFAGLINVRQCRNSAVRIQSNEPRLFLNVGADVNTGDNSNEAIQGKSRP